jgi:hypothetical protein
MADLTSNEGKKPKTASYAALRVEPRLLVTDTLSLAIPHVVSLATDSSHEPELKRRDPKKNALIAGAIATVAIGGVVALMLSSWIALAVAGVAAAIIGLVAFQTPDITAREALSTYHLVVTANGGSAMQFSAPRKATVDAALRIISDKINQPGGAEVYSIDFEQGTILNVGLGRVEHPGDVLGSGRHVLAAELGQTGPPELPPRPLPMDPPRPLSAEPPPPRPISTEPPVPRSLTARLGNGLAAGDNPYAVDYTKVLPIVSDWNRYYEKQPNSGEITQRLTELEILMRAGTPTLAERSRLADLARDLPPMIGGAEEVGAFFRAISKLAGF